MRERDLAARFRLFLLPGFLDAKTCAAIRSEARSAPGKPAPVYVEGSVDPIDQNVRKTTSVKLSEETFSLIHQRLLKQRRPLEKHFKLKLTDCEWPQFLLYKKGDFFVPHEDVDTEQLEFAHLRIRKISLVVFLNSGWTKRRKVAETFRGGSLVFYRKDEETEGEPLAYPLRGETGLLVAFTADTTHEVAPVTGGERFTVISWFR